MYTDPEAAPSCSALAVGPEGVQGLTCACLCFRSAASGLSLHGPAGDRGPEGREPSPPACWHSGSGHVAQMLG